MISFKDWLSSQEERLRAEQMVQFQAKESWVQSVVNLIEQIEGWIKESDIHGLVKLDHEFRDQNDPPRDIYANARLNISVGDRDVSIRPVTFSVTGPRWKPRLGEWSGRVDIIGEPHGYELFRFVGNDGQEEWYLRGTRDYEIKIFNQANLDTALMALFS